MSAVPQTIPIEPPPAPRGAAWIDCAEAAKRAGGNEGAWRRKAYSDFAARGLAELRQPEEGGRARWFIRDDADPRLARVKPPEQLPFDASSLSEEHRAKLAERKQILDDWLAAIAAEPEREATPAFLQRLLATRGVNLTRATLYNWRTAWRAQGMEGLVDERWRRAQPGKLRDGTPADPFLEEVKAFYLDQNCLSKAVCYTLAKKKAAAQGWAIPSLRTTCRFLEGLDAGLVIKKRHGQEAYTNDYKPYDERDYHTLRVNQIWCGDHHQFDVIVKGPDGKLCRPWLTAWEDLRSRKIVGWHLFCHAPNQNTIFAAFRMGCLEHGVPEYSYVDNGKDYDSWALQGETKAMRKAKVRVEFDQVAMGGLFGGLGVRVMHAAPYHPQAKPVERWFRTLKDRFSRLNRTFCGGTPEEKPEHLAERLKAGEAPAFADFCDAFSGWLEADYHGQIHTGHAMDGRTPHEVFEQLLETKRTTDERALELLCQKTTRPVKVGQNGVTLGDGRNYGKGDPALFAHFGKEIYLRYDPADITRVSAWTLEDRFIGFLSADSRMPWLAGEQEYRAGKAALKTFKDARKAVELSPMRMALDPIDAMHAARRLENEQRAAAQPTPEPTPPASVKPVQTTLTSQLDAVRKAAERKPLRMAAGTQFQGGDDEAVDVLAALDAAADRSRGRPAAEDHVDLMELL